MKYRDLKRRVAKLEKKMGLRSQRVWIFCKMDETEKNHSNNSYPIEDYEQYEFMPNDIVIIDDMWMDDDSTTRITGYYANHEL